VSHSDVFEALTVLHHERRIKEVGRRIDPTSCELDLHFGPPLSISLRDALPVLRLPLPLAFRLISLNDGTKLLIVCANADRWKCKKRNQKAYSQTHGSALRSRLTVELSGADADV
jgi:hypothetical protein